MNILTKFEYDGRSVRSVTQDGEPWFVAKDVCDTLGLRNSRQAVAALDDDEKSDVYLNDTRSKGGATQGRTVIIVSEPGLYRLIARSDKPQAKAFLRWVTHEVLPAIRRTGGYSAPNRRMPTSTELAMMVIERDKQLKISREMMEIIQPDWSKYGTDGRGGAKTAIRRASFVSGRGRRVHAAVLLTLQGQMELHLLEGGK